MTNWQLAEDTNARGEVLYFSYVDLLFYLKSCFLYLGLFPEDFEIEAKQLSTLWVAEGFVQARGEEKMEDVAEEYLKELMQRNMIQVGARHYDIGPVRTCRVHNLLRDFAISKARKDSFLDIYGKNSSMSRTLPTRPRRLAIHSDKSSKYFAIHLSNSNLNLRSLLCFDRSFQIGKWKFTFGGQSTKMLRVLSLACAKFKKGLPKGIGELVLVRYLRLRGTGLTTLPAFLGNLVKLQTLDLLHLNIENIHGPSFISKMRHLRHFYVEGCRWRQFDSMGDVVVDDLPRDLLSL